MPDWQPIESAPKDRTLILCWDGRARVICDWCDGGWDVTHDTEDYSWADYAPTHWMPLPEPPNAS